jgi:sortase A
MNTLPMPLTLRRFNNGLTVVVVLLSIYLILMPFVPAFSWWLSHDAPIISRPPTVSVPAANKPDTPKENMLYIPSIGLSQAIHEGPTIRTLRQGVWHIPLTSSPDQGSNTVLAAHRYTYSGAGVFYHLEKINLGDTISVLWQGQRYDYKVQRIVVVPPTQGDVQAPTQGSLLTIYTCTPFWSFTDRLVVQAKLEQNR